MNPPAVDERYGRICEVSLQDARSWDGKWFLTFDLDWADDAVLADTLDLVADSVPKATLFVTHGTPLLERIRADATLELGIHPNFNPLMQGDNRLGGSIGEVLDRIIEVVPDARSMRSHSTTVSGPIVDAVAARGLRFESNIIVPWQSGIALRPWIGANRGVTRVPGCWSDDIHLAFGEPWDARPLLRVPGLRVLCFHPIHLFLNTDRPERYEAARPFFRMPAQLADFVNRDGPGARTLFRDLVQAVAADCG